MSSDEQWVPRDAIIEELVRNNNLSVGAAEAALREAVATGKVRQRGWLGTDPVAITSNPGLETLFIRDREVNRADLRWLMEKQNREPPAKKTRKSPVGDVVREWFGNLTEKARAQSAYELTKRYYNRSKGAKAKGNDRYVRGLISDLKREPKGG